MRQGNTVPAWGMSTTVSDFFPLPPRLDQEMLSFPDNLLPAVTAANSSLPFAAGLPGDSCYDCLKSSSATTDSAAGPMRCCLESF